jgi:hypothetical protein
VKTPSGATAPRAAFVLVASALAVLLTGGLAPTGAAAAPGPRLTVDASSERHRISPLIYGLNYATPALARELRLPVNRWGGNTTDTYNYKLGSYNTGNDYFFENIPDCWDEAYGYCESHRDLRAYRSFVEQNRSTGTETLLTLPMMGRIAKDALKQHPFSCGFPASVFPSQDDFDPYDPNCGNGRRNGNLLQAQPSRTSIATPQGWNAGWIADLKQRYGSAANGGVGIYELGNEPALWNSTHRDMHPQPLTYDELWQRSRELAAEVKQADPAAKTIGPSEWGWPNYFCSAADNTEDGCSADDADRGAHGGTPIVPWFLGRMRDYEQQTGTRLLDYLDLHYYAQGGNSTDVTRSLWDPAYTDPSWINEKIQLLPRMQDWIDSSYPGTGIALSEYNLSVGDATTNALIQADTLGIFAREGVGLATRWPMDYDGDEIDDAFRMFRDYDGKGGSFGDRWARSQSSDQDRLAVYGATRSRDGKLTVVVVNKSGEELSSKLRVKGFRAKGKARAYRWAGGEISRVKGGRVRGGKLAASYPARSITMLALKPRRR